MSIDRNLPSVEQLLTTLGPATGESTAYRRELEVLYQQYPDPDTCYASLRLPPQPRIIWTANTLKVLKWKPAGYENFRERIHPFYADFHLTFGHSAYRCCHQMGREFANRDSYYAVYVPVRRGDDGYFWMRQVSLVTEIDAQGRILTFFNMYRLLEPFGTLQPSRPMVMLSGEIRPDLERRISKLTEAEIMDKFEARLQGAHRNTFRVYRRQYRENPKTLPNSQSVAAELDRRVSTIHTYNKSILEAARATFPAAEFNSVQELLEFLRVIFGEEDPSSDSR